MSTVRSQVAVLAAALLLHAQLLTAQVGLPPGFSRPAQPLPQQQSPQMQPQTPAPAQQPPAQQPGAPPAAPETQTPVAPDAGTGPLNLQNASLRQVIDILARQMKINYILDPRVDGGVTINTYGETKEIDPRTLMDTILRINGAAMVQVGDIYRIVPLADVQRLPIQPEMNKTPEVSDDRPMLNLVFLQFATADEIANVLKEFTSEGAKMWSYPPANLLMILDTRRNMQRLMELVSLFDSDVLANQRVRLFEVQNGRPSDIAQELEGVLVNISLSDKASPVKLIPVDRINTLIAVAPNPGVFKEVENWLKKLDVTVSSPAGAVDNFVYRVRFGYAPTLAMAIMALYSNNPYYLMSMMSMASMQGMGGVGGLNPLGSGGMGMYGGGMGMYGGGMGMYGGGMMPGMFGGGMMPGMYGGMMPGMYAPPAGQAAYRSLEPTPASPMNSPLSTQNLGVAPAQADRTGAYLGPRQPQAGAESTERIPRVIPNPFDNTLLIQATRQEYEAILKLLRNIDVPPRQVLIEAKIYEVNLTGALASGVTAFLQRRGSGGTGPLPAGLDRVTSASGLSITTVGALVDRSRELLAIVTAQETNRNARIVSAPSIVATDSVPASINVGQQVPTLTAQAVTGVQQGGDSLFANTITNKDTGVTLQITPRVNPSGIVTLQIQQEVSAPIAPSDTDAIQSPSFSRRTINTQVTLQDGDTIAIGGIIQDDDGQSSTGIPVLHRLPVVGMLFGTKSFSKARTELIVFMTPRVIYDMNHLNEATDELRQRLRRLSRYLREEDR
jgi:general secretion pathway protein D